MLCLYFHFFVAISQCAPAKKAKVRQPYDKEGRDVFDLGSNRKVDVSELNGRLFVHIRIYFTNKDGKVLPTKAGIALSRKEWQKLLESADEIDAAIAKL